MEITYQNSSDQITLGDCIELHNLIGMAIEFNDGKHITFSFDTDSDYEREED